MLENIENNGKIFESERECTRSNQLISPRMLECLVFIIDEISWVVSHFFGQFDF